MQANQLIEGQWVESYKFADVVRLWARERLLHEVIVGRELVKGIVTQGLRFQSADPRWIKAAEPLRGYPLVGYAALADSKPVMLRASALEHLLHVERTQADPDLSLLREEFITQEDFRAWLQQRRLPLPKFWFVRTKERGTA